MDEHPPNDLVPAQPQYMVPVNYRDQTTGFILWAGGFLGLCGLHRFYADKPFTGLLWLFTAGLCGIGQILDVFFVPGQIAAANARLALAAPVGASQPRLPPPRRISRKDALRIALCRAAKDNGGILTVTDAVLATGEPHEEIEKHLDEMARQRWVDIDNHPDSGVVVYRFTDFA